MKLIKIKKITRKKKEKAYNICVKKNSNFLLANGILTHNTSDAQKALRNTIEMYSNTCRFILTANSVSKIIPALRSRCTPFEFSAFDKIELINYCTDTLIAENIKYSRKDVKTIVERLYPDIRSIFNNLQKCSITGELNSSDLMVFNIEESEIIKLIKKGELKKLRESWAGAGSFDWVYNFLFNTFIFEINEKDRTQVAINIAEYLFRDATVADKEINVSGCIVSIMQELNVAVKF